MCVLFHTCEINLKFFKVSVWHQIPTPYSFLRYTWNKILRVNITTTMSKVKSRSHYDVAHLHPQLIPLPSIKILHLVVLDRILNVKVTATRSSQGHTMMMHTHTCQSILYLMVSEI